MNYKNYAEFKKLVQPLWDFLEENYHPRATIIITLADAEVTESNMFIPNSRRIKKILNTTIK